MHAITYGASASFTYAQGLRLALYRGLHALSARLVQKVVCRGARQPRLMGKTYEVFDVPGVAQWNTIFGLQADCVRPGDSHYPIMAFPLCVNLLEFLAD